MSVNFPNTPNEGDTHTEEGATWIYRNARWVVTQPAAPGPTGAITYGTTFPGSPAGGDLHFLTVEPTGLYMYYPDGNSNQWVMTNGMQNAPDITPDPPGSEYDPTNVESYRIFNDGMMETWGVATVNAYPFAFSFPSKVFASPPVVATNAQALTVGGLLCFAQPHLVTETGFSFYAMERDSSGNLVPITANVDVAWRALGQWDGVS